MMSMLAICVVGVSLGFRQENMTSVHAHILCDRVAQLVALEIPDLRVACSSHVAVTQDMDLTFCCIIFFGK